MNLKRIKKEYKLTVNNKKRVYGETDYKKKTIEVNKKLSKSNPMHKRKLHKNASKYPEVLDTIAHEVRHVMHPKEHEKNIRKNVKKAIKHMNKKVKQKYRSLF